MTRRLFVTMLVFLGVRPAVAEESAAVEFAAGAS